MLITLLILAASAVGFATGRLRSDVVALCALLLLLLTGILTPEEALAGFSNPIVIMMIGLFVVGGAIFRTGLAARIGGSLMRLAGNSQRRLFFLVVVGTALIGAFVSNTGTVALMLPIVVSMSARAGTDARRLLMPLAFASSMGGMLTLIGTPPNLVIQEHLTEGRYAPLSFFPFTPVRLICIAVGALALYPLSRRLVRHDAHDDARHKGGKSLSQLVSEYRLGEQMGHVTVTPLVVSLPSEPRQP